MNLGQTRIDPELIKLVVSLLAAFITAWIIIAQTDKKSRLFLLLVLAWVVFDSYEKWIDFCIFIVAMIIFFHSIKSQTCCKAGTETTDL